MSAPATDQPTPWRDKEKIQELYCEQEMTMEAVAEELGCSISTVSEWVSRHGLEARPRTGPGYQHPRMKTHARFVTTPSGHEKWESNLNGDRDVVAVHRLLAVAEYGFDAVADKVVHHENHIPWDNRPENIRPVPRDSHSRYHQNQRIRRKWPQG